MSIGIVYVVPIIALTNFMATERPILVNYLGMLYQFLANIVFGTFLYMVFVLVVDRPIYSILYL